MPRAMRVMIAKPLVLPSISLNKNIRTYVLLAVVAIIWGIIGFKVVNTVSPDTPEKVSSESVGFKPITPLKKDTFGITAQYRDPFLGTWPKKKKGNPTAMAKKNIAPKRNITYTGSIANKDQKKNIFFVTIEGKQSLMKIGQTVNEVKLVSGSAKHIRVRYNGRAETITLQ